MFWSGNFIAGRALGDQVTALGLNFCRWSIALAILLPFTIGEIIRHRQTIAAAWAYIFLLGLTGVAAFHIFVYQALEHTTATNALLMLASAPAVIVLFSRIFLAESVRWSQWLGIGLSLAGALVLICRGQLAVLMEWQMGQGELWMLAAVPAWAAYSVLFKRKPLPLPQLTTLAVTAMAGLLCMLPLPAIFADSVTPIHWNPEILAGVLYMG